MLPEFIRKSNTDRLIFYKCSSIPNLWLLFTAGICLTWKLLLFFPKYLHISELHIAHRDAASLESIRGSGALAKYRSSSLPSSKINQYCKSSSPKLGEGGEEQK